ncbi:MAG TPA: flagellar protein FlaG [Anaerolineaceae bacterium]|jgi:uncharacterized FlaG/YvyC family protein|nr:flagellar protein FlaG [Anaerolineaceae bacterium]
MNANSVPAIGKIDNEAPRSIRPYEPVEGADARVKPAQESSPKPTEKPQEPKVEAKPQPDVQLRFIVDAQSNEVTVLLLDKATHRIVRTIPPDELSKFKEGDLLSLFA